ncbi:hypothetical protein F5X68DRAFT_245144 [Plectosphaerella plurivora]|uniref:AttH domain-containing protein n=1 Tax=Plectosphaerella plurivora TaxID=936078 RepID=A0A9P8V6L1_9PEZI|nr:hypothetical protein F5X68DRAFT_245144 [Plectosphaerella plurivora]
MLSKISLIAFLAIAASASPCHPQTCSVDVATHDVFVNGKVTMTNDPQIHFDGPMTGGFNASAGEDWSFEGVAADGNSAMAFTLTRGLIVGRAGSQRGLLTAVWPNGTRYMESMWADNSTIEACRDSTTGTWFNGTSGLNWTIQASADFSSTVVRIESANLQGTITLDAISPPLYPNGLVYPSPQGDYAFAPYLYWAESVPVGVVNVNLTMHGSPFVLSGIGGRERNWHSFPWATISARWDMIRAQIGPYTLMSLTYESKIDGQTYFSAVIMEGMEVVFRTRTQQVSTTETYGSFDLAYNGTVRLSSDPALATPLPESRHTGYKLNWVSPATGEHWKFNIDYTKCVYWFPAGQDGRVAGFAGTVTGGLVGGEQYVGRVSGNAMEKNL